MKNSNQLILILDKVDSFDKTKIIANCFDYFLLMQISFDEFCELSHIVNQSFITDLKALSESYKELNNDIRKRLVGSGATEYKLDKTYDENTPFDIVINVSKQGRRLFFIMNKTYEKNLENENEEFIKELMNKLTVY